MSNEVTQRHGDIVKGIDDLRSYTPARVGLGRAGAAMPTHERMALLTAHSSARDAVHSRVDVAGLKEEISHMSELESQTSDRHEYLRRPDLGRRPGNVDHIDWLKHVGDVGFMIVDGLSPQAVNEHAAPLVAALETELAKALPDKQIAAPVFAHRGRVALGDHVGERAGWDTTIVIIGERPGLSVPSSLGMYLTWKAKPGTTDEARNCISNIHPPHGIGYSEAAVGAARLVCAFYERGFSGYQVKAVEGPGDTAIQSAGS